MNDSIYNVSVGFRFGGPNSYVAVELWFFDWDKPQLKRYRPGTFAVFFGPFTVRRLKW